MFLVNVIFTHLGDPCWLSLKALFLEMCFCGFLECLQVCVVDGTRQPRWCWWEESGIEAGQGRSPPASVGEGDDCGVRCVHRLWRNQRPGVSLPCPFIAPAQAPEGQRSPPWFSEAPSFWSQTPGPSQVPDISPDSRIYRVRGVSVLQAS